MAFNWTNFVSRLHLQLLGTQQPGSFLLSASTLMLKVALWKNCGVLVYWQAHRSLRLVPSSGTTFLS